MGNWVIFPASRHQGHHCALRWAWTRGRRGGVSHARVPIQLPKLLEHGPLNPERDNGPFPLRHIDLGIHNIIVDDEWNVLSIINWEDTFAAPWEMVCEGPSLQYMSRTIWPVY